MRKECVLLLLTTEISNYVVKTSVKRIQISYNCNIKRAPYKQNSVEILHHFVGSLGSSKGVDLEVQDLIPMKIEIFSNINEIPLRQSLSSLPSYHPDMTEILLEMIYPSS